MMSLFDRPVVSPRADRDDIGGMRKLRSQRSTFSAQHSLFPRHALSLIEMLVALAVTLVMMAAVVNLFANISGSIRNRRAAIEAGAQLRQVRQRLALDLAGATCRGATWQDPAENQGYIELIEGEWSDKNPSALIDGNPSNGELDYATSLIPSSQVIDSASGQVTDGRALGDWDDALALTVRSESDPFVARDGGEFVESPLAEVIWFANERGLSAPSDPYDGMRTVYRRVLLIAPWRGPWTNRPNNISAHWDVARNQWVANTLGDLTKRENRATRDDSSLFPFPLERHNVPADRDNARILPGNTSLQAVVLSNTLAFDVRAFDPGAPLYETNGTALEPTDAGWLAAIASGATPVGYGAYCDLGWGFDPYSSSMAYPQAPLPNNVPTPLLNEVRPAGYHPISNRVGNALNFYPCVYDTWSYHYENDGINQDSTVADAWRANALDQGANGLDDDNANGVDDKGERETAPPYDVPLRGVKVIFRVYERDARQIREASVTHGF